MARTTQHERTERDVSVQIDKVDLIQLLRLAHEDGEPDFKSYPEVDADYVMLKYHSSDGHEVTLGDEDYISLEWKEVEERDT
jgi:hypothetical protein